MLFRSPHFKAFVRQELCNDKHVLSPDDVLAIEEIEKEYLTPEFIYGNNPRYTAIRKQRIENVGEFEVRIEMNKNIVKQVNIMGDFFLTGDIDNRLLSVLKNIPYTEEAISFSLWNHYEIALLTIYFPFAFVALAVALPHARIMIHQPLGGFQGQATDIDIHAREILRIREDLNRILSAHSGKTLKKIQADTERDNFMSAAQACEYGLIDKVLSNREQAEGARKA